MKRLILLSFLFLTAIIVNANDEQLMSPIEKLELANNFSLPDLEGNEVNLSDYKGKYVLVNFWALWCSPCVEEFPAMESLYKNLKNEGLEILAIHAGPAEVVIKDFLLDNNISFKVILDEKVSLKGWKIPALPISYLVNPEGELIYKAIGPREWDVNEMRELISASKK